MKCGTPKDLPINEKNLLQPQSPYAASKVAADQLAMSYNKSFNLPVTIIRPFNNFGLDNLIEQLFQQLLIKFLIKKIIFLK